MLYIAIFSIFACLLCLPCTIQTAPQVGDQSGNSPWDNPPISNATTSSNSSATAAGNSNSSNDDIAARCNVTQTLVEECVKQTTESVRYRLVPQEDQSECPICMRIIKENEDCRSLMLADDSMAANEMCDDQLTCDFESKLCKRNASLSLPPSSLTSARPTEHSHKEINLA